jgi:cytolysin (calcineurin-like family phosphatase)
MVTHDRKTMAVDYHGADNFDNPAVLSATINQITDKYRFPVNVLIDSMLHRIAKLEQEVFKLVRMAVDVTYDVVEGVFWVWVVRCIGCHDVIPGLFFMSLFFSWPEFEIYPNRSCQA